MGNYNKKPCDGNKKIIGFSVKENLSKNKLDINEINRRAKPSPFVELKQEETPKQESDKTIQTNSNITNKDQQEGER